MIVPYVPPWKKKQYAFKPHIDQRVQPGQHWIGRDLDIYNPRRMGILDRQAAAATRERNIASQASQTPTAPFGGGIGKSAYQGVGSKKKGNKLKYIVEALQELEGPEPPKLAGGNFGRAMPRALGFSLPGMGGRLEEQEAMAKARREEELQRRMKLMGGGY
tara:strand:- start:12 stop:494 length:483 start_codon:yes stop_codon:yes gene_type:complete